MAAGYTLTQGDLKRNSVAVDAYWAHFNYVFSNACKKTTTYKFGLIKAILDCLYSAVETSNGLEIGYDILFTKFAENYWNLIAKYNICQIRNNGRASILEQVINRIKQHRTIPDIVEFENLSYDDQRALVQQILHDCKRYVIGALYQDFSGELYGFDNRRNLLWLHIGAYQFLMAYRIEIEQMNYYAWARFLEQINEHQPVVGLVSKLELSTPQRHDLSLYRSILRDVFETNVCYYCGAKLHASTHVDHVLPWSFVKSDHLWNLVLSCPKCNLRKRDYLPRKETLAEVVLRNKEFKRIDCPIVQKEFIGYTDDIMWQIWDYAKQQGYRVAT